MPQPFENAVLTNSGAHLITRAQAGEIKIEFTRIAVGNGVYSAEEKTIESLQIRTELKAKKNSYTLSDISIFSEHSVKVTALITNQDPVTGSILVQNGYFINEMGLYAKVKGDNEGTTEVLYSIVVTASDNGDFMPPYNGYNSVQIIQDYYVTVNNSADVTIQIGAGAAVLKEDFQEIKDAVQYIIDGGNIEKAFYKIFTNIAVYEEDEAMTYEDVMNALGTVWNGETSPDETAMSAADITNALNTVWNGETSPDKTALTAWDIYDVIG